MRGQVKEWWGKLTGDDLEQVEGKADQLVAMLQQKYGYTRAQAEQELAHWLQEARAAWNRIANACRSGLHVWRRALES